MKRIKKESFRIYFENDTVEVDIDELTPVSHGNKTVYETHIKGARVKLSLTPCQGVELAELEVSGDKPLGISRIDCPIIALEPPEKTDRFMLFGNSLYHSENRFPCELREGAEYFSDGAGLFASPVSEGTALAFTVPLNNIAGAGAVLRDGGYYLFAKTEFTEGMKNQRRLCTERVLCFESVTVSELFDVYRELLPQSDFPMPKLCGWNSWDYYLDSVCPEDIFENVRALKEAGLSDELEYIVIDDGWQKDWGDWCENEKFSCGLEAVAREIIAYGFKPGIWMAPLLMKKSVTGFEDRMDWFCRDAKGEYIRDIGDTYLIDPTVPDAKSFILESYKRLYQKGYRLFKIDYLSPLSKAKSFFDPKATAYSALSELIGDIKNATGEDVVILGCSLPVQCGANVAPSMRIAVDIHNQFPHVKWIAEALTWTWMYNGIVTRIDPDFLVVRGKDTSDEELKWAGEPKYLLPKRRSEMTDGDFFKSRWRNGDQFNELEARTWARLVAVCGGNIFLSDRISALNEKGIGIINEALEAARDSARPVFLPDDIRLPSVWMAEDEILVINWEDVPAVKRIEGLKRSPEGDGEFKYHNGVLEVTLLPHESFLARL